MPKGVAKKYIYEEENVAKLNKLLKEKRYVNPIFMKGDNGFYRFAHMMKNHLSHYKKFKTYYS